MEKTKKKKDWRSFKMRQLRNEVTFYKNRAEVLEKNARHLNADRETFKKRVHELTQAHQAAIQNVEMLMYAMRLIRNENYKAQLEIRQLNEQVSIIHKDKLAIAG